MRSRFGIVAVPALVLAGVAAGDVIPIAPFTGEFSEPLNFSNTNISASQPIFGGRAHLNSHNGQTFIHLLLGDTIGGDTVTPRTGSYILGWTEGPGVFVFDTPVARFGGYMNNNSGVSDATVMFFDVANNPLGTRVATAPAPGNVWTWNGWESDVGIARIEVHGTGLLNGFLWFDDMEMTTVPAPGGIAAAALALAIGARRRRLPGWTLAAGTREFADRRSWPAPKRQR
jgi:hypothetical protein